MSCLMDSRGQGWVSERNLTWPGPYALNRVFISPLTQSCDMMTARLLCFALFPLPSPITKLVGSVLLLSSCIHTAYLLLLPLNSFRDSFPKTLHQLTHVDPSATNRWLFSVSFPYLGQTAAVIEGDILLRPCVARGD